MDAASLFILEAAAYTHDIGIKPAEEKYGSSDGKLQEQEGPIVAQKMLSELGFENYIIDRICYLIGHHHTYDNVEGLDYQVLIEADFLVNLYEDDINRNGIESAYKNIFRTDTGKRIFEEMFLENQRSHECDKLPESNGRSDCTILWRGQGSETSAAQLLRTMQFLLHCMSCGILLCDGILL